jgi:hypothetical protein
MMHEYYWSAAEVRLSDRERKAATRRLRHHHARGRIDAIELEERTDAVGFARNRGDIARVFADLEAPVRRGGPWAFRRGWFPLFPIIPILWIAAIVIAISGHVPWVPLVILGVLLLVVAPSRRRRRWAGYAC